ncbi:MAG: DNA polymerase III subunit delta' [Bacteroidales bacterium]|nr:DNA polymerase III subunit delta' [Bacteroidales bacterium]MBN2633766.1 DNA polymerase III subunit delta' [Bacteroidales bacterium]
MKFSSIPGQKETIEKLVCSVREERVSHAQLFTGPEGCGAFALALAYATYISCENRNDHDSCGTCKSCVKYEKMIHPDLHFVFPVVKKKESDPVSDSFIDQWRQFTGRSPYFRLNDWLNYIEVENSQGMIYADEAGEIIKKLSLKTFESDFKIMIIWLPEKMHPAAANKLLKLIEEPPDKTLFLLVSDEPDKVLPTILSRCQMLKIPRFSTSDIYRYLTDIQGVDLKKAEETARISNGNILRAIQLTGQEDSSWGNLDNFKKLMRSAWKRDVLSLISWSEEIATTGREAQKSFLLYSLRIIRENLMLTMGQNAGGIISLSDEEALFSNNFHPYINESNIFKLTEEFSLAHSHIEANGYSKLVFLDLALKVARVIR